MDPRGEDPKDPPYDRTLLGKPFKIEFSPKIDELTRAEILANIDQSINRINNPKNHPLTADEQKVISSVKSIEVTPDIVYEHTIGSRFRIRPEYGLQDNDGLTGAMLHDSYHAYKGTGGVKEEMKASRFAIGPPLKIGLGETVIQWLCRDSLYGHKPPANNPYKKSK